MLGLGTAVHFTAVKLPHQYIYRPTLLPSLGNAYSHYNDGKCKQTATSIRMPGFHLEQKLGGGSFWMEELSNARGVWGMLPQKYLSLCQAVVHGLW